MLLTIGTFQKGLNIGGVITISVYYNDIMHSLCILRGQKTLFSFTIELPGVDRNGKFWEFSLPPSDITWVLTINANNINNLNVLKFNM